MVADKIKYLREEKKITQAELAKILGITRSSVNAWEMGISVPSTQYIVELANIFRVSTDFLLGIDNNATISTEGLSDEDIKLVYGIIEHLKRKNDTV
ncbi:MAG: helix-turn-helix transcriptional regulator [Clostridia bacterium]|nr:helix-turn-helix transcriptional regulator [Clostridia bacterium]